MTAILEPRVYRQEAKIGGNFKRGWNFQEDESRVEQINWTWGG